MWPPNQGSVKTSIFVVVARIRRLVGALDTATKISLQDPSSSSRRPESFKLIRRKIRSGKVQAPTEIYRLVNL